MNAASITKPSEPDTASPLAAPIGLQTPAGVEQRPTAAVRDEPEDSFLARDLSWLEFNRRVPHEVPDARTPQMEAVRFMAVFTSDLDEFLMKRVGLLKSARTTANHAAHTPANTVRPFGELNDHRQAWDLHADGSYLQHQPANDLDNGTQATLMRLSRERNAPPSPKS